MSDSRRGVRASAPCPACDNPLDVAVAGADEPICSACGEHLVPIRVVGLWQRSLAGGVDLAALGLSAGLLSWGLLALVPPTPVIESGGLAALLEVLAASPRDILAWIAPFVLMAGVYLLLFWGLSGQTLGQRVLKIRVVDRRGRPPGPLLAAVRVLGFGLGLLPFALGTLWIAFDVEKRGLHDWLARTYVIDASGGGEVT